MLLGSVTPIMFYFPKGSVKGMFIEDLETRLCCFRKKMNSCQGKVCLPLGNATGHWLQTPLEDRVKWC